MKGAEMMRKSSLWTPIATVASESEPGRSYVVSRHRDGRIGCACFAYRFARGEKTCKHLRAWAGGEMLPQPRSSSLPQVVVVAGETFTVRRAISFGAVR